MATVVGKDTSAVKRCTCKSCASIIEYTLSELQKSSGRDIDGTGYTQEWLNCPQCNNRIVVRST